MRCPLHRDAGEWSRTFRRPQVASSVHGAHNCPASRVASQERLLSSSQDHNATCRPVNNASARCFVHRQRCATRAWSRELDTRAHCADHRAPQVPRGEAGRRREMALALHAAHLQDLHWGQCTLPTPRARGADHTVPRVSGGEGARRELPLALRSLHRQDLHRRRRGCAAKLRDQRQGRQTLGGGTPIFSGQSSLRLQLRDQSRCSRR
mmetsp:Transcript_99572/g.287401  ORF Transcript_99572/g.287401 Transcript_99572/m.287401 type:complete len:208 (-) Transcript_99572:478-1101(-)